MLGNSLGRMFQDQLMLDNWGFSTDWLLSHLPWLTSFYLLALSSFPLQQPGIGCRRRCSLCFGRYYVSKLCSRIWWYRVKRDFHWARNLFWPRCSAFDSCSSRNRTAFLPTESVAFGISLWRWVRVSVLIDQIFFCLTSFHLCFAGFRLLFGISWVPWLRSIISSYT